MAGLGVAEPPPWAMAFEGGSATPKGQTPLLSLFLFLFFHSLSLSNHPQGPNPFILLFISSFSFALGSGRTTPMGHGGGLATPKGQTPLILFFLLFCP
jgi:hypothetical protein